MSRLPRMFRPRLLDERFEDRPHAGVQVEAAREVLLRLSILALDESRDTSVPMGPSVLRIELDRLVEVGDRPAQISLLWPGNAAVGVGLRVARIEADRSIEIRDRLAGLTRFMEPNPFIVRVVSRIRRRQRRQRHAKSDESRESNNPPSDLHCSTLLAQPLIRCPAPA